MSYDDYYQHLLAADRQGCSRILREKMVDGNIDSVVAIYQDYIQRALYDVGADWQNNRISVATEHLVTSLSEALLNELYQRIAVDGSTGYRVIITSAEREFHRVGGRMISDIFEAMGWDSIYVGADTPTNDLVTIINEKQPDVIGISMTIYFNLPILSEMLTSIRSVHPDIPILLGGQGLQQAVDYAAKFKQIHYMHDIESVIHYIKSFQHAAS